MIEEKTRNLFDRATITCEPINLNVDMFKPFNFPISCIGIDKSKEDRGVLEKMDRYIINENATIIFWKDGTKTISRVDAEDTFDKEIGFMIAVYKYLGANYTTPRWSKTELRKQLNCVKGSKLYDFLFINFNKYSFQDTNKAKKFLSELKVEKTKKKEEKPLPKIDKRVIIINAGDYYSGYEEFIKEYFPEYLKYWNYGSYGYNINKIYNLIGTENHIDFNCKVSLIQDPDTKEVFMFENRGLKFIDDEIEVL